jgi:hypothetical protein
MKNRRRSSFSPTNALENKGKLGYIKLNIQTPKAFGAVPVNSGRIWEAFSLYSFRFELR